VRRSDQQFRPPQPAQRIEAIADSNTGVLPAHDFNSALGATPGMVLQFLPPAPHGTPTITDPQAAWKALKYHQQGLTQVRTV
jgi:hypothetical protein